MGSDSPDRTQPLDAASVALIRETLPRLERVVEIFGLNLYGRLIKAAPEFAAMFSQDTDSLSRRFFQALTTAAAHLEDWDRHRPQISALGRRHGYFGVQARHYELLKPVLVEALQTSLGEEFTPAHANAWARFYDLLSGVMIRASTPILETEVDTSMFFKRPDMRD